MKILIITPATNLFGGISNFFKVLDGKFNLRVDYFIRGIKKENKTFHTLLEGIYYTINVFQFFFKLLIHKRYRVIHLNTSLDNVSLVRDAVYITLARLFKRKIMVFFHGLNIQMQEKLEKSKKFKRIFFKANGMVVLSSAFREKLIRWGYDKEIHIATTVIEDIWLKDFNLDDKLTATETKSKQFCVLFVSRIIKEKGIFELLDGFKLVNQKYPDSKLVIVGDGKEFDHMKQYTIANSINNVDYTGFLSGVEKYNKFREADMLILPSYTEGMPTVIVEAMAFGLPVVASKVGGIPDLIKNDEFGYLLNEITALDIAQNIEKLIIDKVQLQKISKHNYLYAKENLVASRLVKKLEDIYQNLI
jgi:glycosyltransferase involved in cell wall biosynthesis